MKVVHVELPRIFSLSVKEYMTEVAGELARAGHGFAQFDLNPLFWKWLLGLSTPRSPGDLWMPLIGVGDGVRDRERLWRLLAETRGHLNDVSRLYGVQVGLHGIALPVEVVNSSYAMCSLVADNYGVGLFSNFFQTLEELGLRDADVISFGVESPEGLFWALHLAAWLKSADSEAHFCIGRHAWENFSLLPHMGDLAKNPWFFGVIDSVILYQEELPASMSRLVKGLREEGAIENVAIKRSAGVATTLPQQEKRTELRVSKKAYKVPDAYFEAMGTPREHLVYDLAMVRNKCFYKKCTFCVQIAKHISDHAYAEAAEIERALAACEELASHGITMINFMDEAMRPVDLRDFCSGLLQRGIRMHWVGRMIAAANPSREILRLMKEAGCTEILFGLETFDRAVSADMGKVSKSHERAEETAAMVETFLDSGLFVILSMIYEFPTETPEARARTLAHVEGLRARSNRFAMIFNRFHLLHESAMYKEPGKFNIRAVEPRLPENDLQYHFGYACQMPQTTASAQELATMQRLKMGLTPAQEAEAQKSPGKEILEMAYFLDYVSLGFRHRALHDKTLLADLFTNAAPRSP